MPRETLKREYMQDSDDEADDLAFDELGPGNAVERTRDVPLRKLRGTTERGQPRNSARKASASPHAGLESEEELEELLGDREDVAEEADSSHRIITPDVRHPRPRQPALSRIWSKLSASPQTAQDDEYDPSTNRHIEIGRHGKFPPNAVSNAKYTPISFLPRTLYNEFSFFFNLYFLLVALSQLIPPLRIGYLSTYIAPLAFVLVITIGKEALDDITRRRRDAELNAESYTVLEFDDASQNGARPRQERRNTRMYDTHEQKNDDHSKAIGEEEARAGTSQGNDLSGTREIWKASKNLKVGDVLKLGKDQRVPADAVVLKSVSGDNVVHDADNDGEIFIRTDQLDGETDWKLRLAPPITQGLPCRRLEGLKISAGKPDKKVNEFVGTLHISTRRPLDDQDDTVLAKEAQSFPLNIDNTLWANTILASTATVYAVVVYTGSQTRQALSTSATRTKTGLLEYEINALTKILCALTLLLSVILVAAYKFESPDGRKWYITVMRYLILFSTIIPISLRVNLDMGKSVYAWFIQRDKDIPGTIVRTSTIPEDLGRIEYLLSDKTGTLTQNDMNLKKIHVGTGSYANDAMSEVSTYIRQGYGLISDTRDVSKQNRIPGTSTRSRREIGSRVRDVVLALALCHNVTPIVEDEEGKETTSYQASSPDEIAIVKWTESVGLRLAHRDRHSMVLESTSSGEVVARVKILSIFPFTSEGKRMGILLRFVQNLSSPNDDDTSDDPIWFYQKGADTVMSSIVASNDWLDEETANMAREGLRTLVVGRKKLSPQTYQDFTSQYKKASMALNNRDAGVASVVKEYLEKDLELLGVTGVEDKLQQEVKPSLELLRNAGVKIWMLTGDKVETARCVAISSKLVARGQYIHTIVKVKRKDKALDALDFLRSKPDACLLIDGESLSLMLNHLRDAFITIACTVPAVIACRCSPSQKADLARLIRAHTRKRICCIGDGGNDVSMIQAADVGIGIVGKEGRQASLAADFSVTQFSYLTKLLVWHGRNSYKRSAKLAQFVMHRGLVISICQTVYSMSAGFEPKALYRDWLLVGYATVYTMFPVFSLVLDTDIPPALAKVYPELYAELSTSRALSYTTFFAWVAISTYQGIAIQLLSQALTKQISGPHMVAVSYTAIVVNELVMMAAEVTTWHWIMIVSVIGTAGVFLGSYPLLGEYFDVGWIWSSFGFWWRMAVAAGVALGPVLMGGIVRRYLRPESYRKVLQGG